MHFVSSLLGIRRRPRTRTNTHQTSRSQGYSSERLNPTRPGYYFIWYTCWSAELMGFAIKIRLAQQFGFEWLSTGDCAKTVLVLSCDHLDLPSPIAASWLFRLVSMSGYMPFIDIMPRRFRFEECTLILLLIEGRPASRSKWVMRRINGMNNEDRSVELIDQWFRWLSMIVHVVHSNIPETNKGNTKRATYYCMDLASRLTGNR